MRAVASSRTKLGSIVLRTGLFARTGAARFHPSATSTYSAIPCRPSNVCVARALSSHYPRRIRAQSRPDIAHAGAALLDGETPELVMPPHVVPVPPRRHHASADRRANMGKPRARSARGGRGRARAGRICLKLSFPRKRESKKEWIAAFAAMT